MIFPKCLLLCSSENNNTRPWIFSFNISFSFTAIEGHQCSTRIMLIGCENVELFLFSRTVEAISQQIYTFFEEKNMLEFANSPCLPWCWWGHRDFAKWHILLTLEQHFCLKNFFEKMFLIKTFQDFSPYNAL